MFYAFDGFGLIDRWYMLITSGLGDECDVSGEQGVLGIRIWIWRLREWESKVDGRLQGMGEGRDSIRYARRFCHRLES